MAEYEDLPNRLAKVSVKDRTLVKTADDSEMVCVAPLGLQTTIDNLCAQFANSRAFVRPSGTEDVVRVYAEAETEKDVETLMKQVINCNCCH